MFFYWVTSAHFIRAIISPKLNNYLTQNDNDGIFCDAKAADYYRGSLKIHQVSLK
jgi:hypothetical protein